jgi:hypothetical protein
VCIWRHRKSQADVSARRGSARGSPLPPSATLRGSPLPAARPRGSPLPVSCRRRTSRSGRWRGSRGRASCSRNPAVTEIRPKVEAGVDFMNQFRAKN